MDVPSVKFANATNDGVVMPVTVIGTWGYGVTRETWIWNDDISQ